MPKVSEKKTVKKVVAKASPEKKVVEKKTAPKKVAAKVQEAKTAEIQAQEAHVLKSGELGTWGFLSGLGFAKTEEKKLSKEEVQQQKEQEDEQESIFLEKPRHSPMSFDTVAPIKHAFVGGYKEPERPRTHTPARPATSSQPRNTQPQHGGQQRAPSYAKPMWGGYHKPEFRKASPGGSRGIPSSQKRPPYAPASHTFPRPTTPAVPHVKVYKEASASANLVKKQEIILQENITVKEFSEKMGVPLQEVMKKLLENKIMKWITASLDFDTATLIASEFNVDVKKKENTLNVESFMTGDLQAILDLDKEAPNLVSRPPIVTIMGHVDHGKTSLLDYLRKTVVAEGEAGGITQSIWASVVDCNGKKICFIDTPGHELFTSLRARGAKLTNIAVIVIAADDSVMPQTIESIGHAKDAGVPIIVAITKIDKVANNIEQIKMDIAKYGLTPEDWWGDVPVVGISSKTGQGIPELLEAILLQSEMLDLKYNPKRAAVGVILDAHKDPKQGVVSTIIVMSGTLKIGDIVVIYNTYGKIRRMQNRKGQSMVSATGGEPVQVLGITSLPEPGRILEVVKNEKEAQERIATIQEHVKQQSGESVVQHFISQLQSWTAQSELRLILKSDGSSSLEALKQAVDAIPLPKNVTIKVVHSDVWHFSDSDLSLAQASSSLLLGFNISMNALLKKKADNMKIEMKNYDIIYELTDYLTNLLLGMVEIEQHEVMFAKLQVMGIFFTKNKDMTVGGKVIFGKLHGKPKFTVLRGEDIFCTGHVVSLHRNKDEVKEVGEGEECGIKVTTGKKIEIGDVIEFFEMQDVVD